MELTEQIRRRVEELLASADDRVAASTGALLLYSDWTGGIALRPEGSFIFYDWETGDVTAEDDPSWQLLALVQGSRDYPELGALLPEKSEEARECPLCQGAGCLVIEGHVCKNLVCGKCFGLGWVNEYLLSLSEQH